MSVVCVLFAYYICKNTYRIILIVSIIHKKYAEIRKSTQKYAKQAKLSFAYFLRTIFDPLFTVSFLYLQRQIKNQKISEMKQIALAFLFMTCLTMQASTMYFNSDTKINIALKFHYYYDDSDDDLRGCEKGKRTSAFVPITATHSADNLYLESSISLEEVAVTVKDEWGYVVYETITPLFADEQAAFPLNLSEGCYTLEIKYGGVCLLGNFDL